MVLPLYPFKKFGFKWIPQQLWKFRKMPFGIWTGCFHPNEMNEREIFYLEQFVKKNRNYFIQNIKDIKFRKICIFNKLFEETYWILIKLKRILN